MRRIRRRALALATLVALAACAHRAPRAHVEQPALPNGIVTTAPLVPGRVYGGLYPSREPGLGVWTAPNARFVLHKPRRAARLALIFYVPNGSAAARRWYNAHPVAIDVAVGNGPMQRRCCFKGGMSSLHVAVPVNLRDTIGNVPIRLRVEGAAVPHDVDPAVADPRRLGVILLRLFFY